MLAASVFQHAACPLFGTRTTGPLFPERCRSCGQYFPVPGLAQGAGANEEFQPTEPLDVDAMDEEPTVRLDDEEMDEEFQPTAPLEEPPQETVGVPTRRRRRVFVRDTDGEEAPRAGSDDGMHGDPPCDSAHAIAHDSAHGIAHGSARDGRDNVMARDFSDPATEGAVSNGMPAASGGPSSGHDDVPAGGAVQRQRSGRRPRTLVRCPQRQAHPPDRIRCWHAFGVHQASSRRDAVKAC